MQSMNERANRLRQEVKDGLTDLWDEQIRATISEAREEALAEAKAILKDAILRAVLERAVDGWSRELSPGGFRGDENGLEPRPEMARPAAQGAASKQEIRQEIEGIRRRIADNERLVSQFKVPPTGAKGTEEPRLQEAESSPKNEAGEGYYLYGIVGRNNCPAGALANQGIDPARPVYAVPYQDLQAIVSRVSLREFSQRAVETNLQDMKWVEAKVGAHQRVLDRVLAHRTVIPMKFCTVCETESRVGEMMTEYYREFLDALARLEGKEEWGVKVYCDQAALTDKVAETSQRVKQIEKEMSDKPDGAAYFLKKKVEEAIADEAERASNECALQSHDCLSMLAEEATLNALQSGGFPGGKEEMILNGAYLLHKERVGSFHAEVTSLAQDYPRPVFSYAITGPWPAYNFVGIGSDKEGIASD